MLLTWLEIKKKNSYYFEIHVDNGRVTFWKQFQIWWDKFTKYCPDHYIHVLSHLSQRHVKKTHKIPKGYQTCH